jgi:Pyruvate/2-oxoacid:ferredoxin oxidoreductase delta subunit
MPFGFGRGGGRGKHRRGGMGRGRMRTSQGRLARIPENCICPQCGTTIPHQLGVPCFQTSCPNCRSFMTRQFNVPGEQAPAQQASSTQKPVVDQDVCTGCQKCIPVCPEQAIEMRNEKAFILAVKCTNCRLCVPICPVSAIN